MKICLECGSKLTVMKKEKFCYTGSGLDNVYLQGIIQYECHECGRNNVKIPDIKALHFLIAVNLVFKMDPLSHSEIGYLKRIIKEKSWRLANRLFDDSYQSGPMLFQREGKEWR